MYLKDLYTLLGNAGHNSCHFRVQPRNLNITNLYMCYENKCLLPVIVKCMEKA